LSRNRPPCRTWRSWIQPNDGCAFQRSWTLISAWSRTVFQR